MFIDDDTLSGYVKDVTARASTETLSPHWTSIIARNNKMAYYFIVSFFARRGYTKAQIDLWDFGAEFQAKIGIYTALQELAAMQPDAYGSAALEAIDGRKDLMPADGSISVFDMLIINGEAVEGEGDLGQIVVGQFDFSKDQFDPYDPNDFRMGKPTRW